MAAGRVQGMDLVDETAINVVGLLKESVGSARIYKLRLSRFDLDDDLVARDVRGEIRLTKLANGVMAAVSAVGQVELECVRCLRPYDEPFDLTFTEEYRQTVDVRTGLGLDVDLEDVEEPSIIDENHEIDLGEALRQEVIVALPMRPDCGEACPGPDQVATEAADEEIDDRFAALGRLLENE
jgi:uncharacterized protein